MNIAIAGTGYVGLVTGVCLAYTGQHVWCVDSNEQKINTLTAGKSPIYETDLEKYMALAKSNLIYTCDYAEAYRNADVIFIAVGTPESSDGSANTDFVYNVARQIAETIAKDCVIVVKSTVPIGTNDKIEAFIKSNLNSSILKDKSNKDELKIIYTPLNGTGRKYVPKALKEDGFNNIIIVKEQEESDPNFTTCPKPNPELKETLSLGISYLNKFDASILIATDPDADRCGVVIKTKENKIYLPSGNEIALLLLNFIIEYNLNYLHKDISYFKDKIVVRSIVSTSLVDKICFKYNIKLKTVLTGFKFIGEEINNLELNNKLDSYLIGFEESYGYLTNTDIRDKDSINASILISEMTYFYKEQGLDLVDKLDLIYKEYGYYKNILLTHNFLGEDGMNKMKKIMNNLRELNLNELSNLIKEEVKSKEDYLLSKEININNEIKDLSLPKSDVLIINFKNNTRFMIRPSGTEPKLKCYIEVSSKSEEESNNLINKYKELFNVIIK